MHPGPKCARPLTGGGELRGSISSMYGVGPLVLGKEGEGSAAPLALGEEAGLRDVQLWAISPSTQPLSRSAMQPRSPQTVGGTLEVMPVARVMQRGASRHRRQPADRRVKRSCCFRRCSVRFDCDSNRRKAALQTPHLVRDAAYRASFSCRAARCFFRCSACAARKALRAASWAL